MPFSQDQNIQRIQKNDLELLKSFSFYCQKAGIHFSLDGGTLIGAVREKGFIQWDDDIDVCVTRKTQIFLTKHFSEIFPSDFYYVFFDNNPTLWIHFKSKKSLLDEWIDIFAYDTIKNDFLADRNIKLYGCLEGAYVRNSHHWGSDIGERKNNGIKTIFAKMIPRFAIIQLLKKLERDNRKDPKRIEYSGSKNSIKLVFSSDLFDEFIMLNFENFAFPCFKNYDTYLSRQYGDYMTPPPESERKNHTDLGRNHD